MSQDLADVIDQDYEKQLHRCTREIVKVKNKTINAVEARLSEQHFRDIHKACQPSPSLRLGGHAALSEKFRLPSAYAMRY